MNRPSALRSRAETGRLLLSTLGLLVATLALGAASPLEAQAPAVTAPASPNITFTPGLRIQTRYTYDNADGNNDFFIARTRIKATGEAFGISKYGVEIKIDNVGRFAREANAQVENAWIDLPALKDLSFRVGLYDAVFSRNALTSDSKLLLMDRSLIKDALTSLGLADNSVGLLVHGRPLGGRLEYSMGMFDNLQFEQSGTPTAKQADGTMQMARAGVHLLDPAPHGGYADYRSSYIGKGRRLSIAGNVAFLSQAHEGPARFDISAFGGDAFFNSGPVSLEGEYDQFLEDIDPTASGGLQNRKGEGWYVQAGYLVYHPFELAARYQERDADRGDFATGLNWTTIGTNVYIRDHTMKVQGEYTFKREEGGETDNDLFQLQFQLDF